MWILLLLRRTMGGGLILHFRKSNLSYECLFVMKWIPTKERLRIANNGSQKLIDAQARIVEHRQTQDRSLPTAPNGSAYLLLLAMDCRQVATSRGKLATERSYRWSACLRRTITATLATLAPAKKPDFPPWVQGQGLLPPPPPSGRWLASDDRHIPSLGIGPRGKHQNLKINGSTTFRRKATCSTKTSPWYSRTLPLLCFKPSHRHLCVLGFYGSLNAFFDALMQ